jgi:hypothetical protein
MAELVCAGAQIQCTAGTIPSTLIVAATTGTAAGVQPLATINDHLPMTNIPPFGLCMSPANPAVATATAAAQGVLTPQPCTPMTTAPWSPGSISTLLLSMPAVLDVSRCLCTYGGVVSVLSPGQVFDSDI